MSYSPTLCQATAAFPPPGMNAIRREELHPRAGVVEAVDLPRHRLLVLVLLVFVPVPLLTLGGLAVPFPELAQRALAPFLPFVEHSAASQQGARTLAILPALTETPRSTGRSWGSRPRAGCALGRAGRGDGSRSSEGEARRPACDVVRRRRGRCDDRPEWCRLRGQRRLARIHAFRARRRGDSRRVGNRGERRGIVVRPLVGRHGPDSGVERNLGLEHRRRIRVERSLEGRLRWLRLR